MPPLERGQQRQCPIGLFEEAEHKIRSLTTLINGSRNIQDKADLARSLMEQTEKLLQCESFDEGNMSCRLCRQFSALRQNTAVLILKLAGAPGPDKRGTR